MRPYVIINGVNSNTITGLIISKLPPVTKPQMRLLTEQIDGRDGDINTPLGFSAYDKPLEIGLTAEADVNEVIAYFNQAGKIIFSNEPDKYYNFAIYDAIDYEKLIRFKTATINLHTQPYKYSNTQGAIALNSGSNTVVNSGNTVSKPDLILEGSGVVNLSINNRQIIEADLTDVNKILIDSDTMNAYSVNVINPIKSIKSDINPVQDLHGYSKPWSGGGGKNKFNDTTGTHTINANTDVTLVIGDVYLEANTIYTISCKQTPAPLTSFVRNTLFVVGGGSTTYNPAGNDYTIKPMTFTPTVSGIYSVRVWGHTLSANTTYSEFQVEKGSTATAYEPYSNICPISGFSALNVTRTGKNLVNIPDKVQTGGGYLFSNYYINLPQGTYTLSFDSTANHGQCNFVVKKDNASIGSVTTNLTTGRVSLTVTITQKSTKIECYANTGGTFSNIQLELGNQASEYHAYNGQTATVNFGQTVYGGVVDVTNGKVIITHEYCVLNGTETITSNTQGGHTRFSCQKLVNLADNNASNENFCSHFLPASAPIGQNQIDNAIGVYNRGLYWRADQFTDVTAMKNYLLAQYNANTPVMYVAKLATPIEIITTPENLTALSGQNNVYGDTNGDTEVKVKIDGEEQTLTGEIVTFNIDELEYELGAFANRIVTGNYDNIKLEVGSNNVELTGAFTGGQLTRYSRWL